MGKTCVCGAEELQVDTKARRFTAPDGTVVERGRRHLDRRLHRPGVAGRGAGRALVGGPLLRGRDRRRSLGRPTIWCAACTGSWPTPTQVRRLDVRTNADTPEDAARARRFGAQGIGLCRTEHMFLGDRRQFVEKLILADGDEERQAALDALRAAAEAGLPRDLRGDGRPAGDHPAARPAAARVPARPHRPLGAGGAWPRRAGTTTRATCGCWPRCAACTRRTRCSACAASASASSCPGLFAMQVRAIAEAACERQPAGGDPRPEIMIPLVGRGAGAGDDPRGGGAGARRGQRRTRASRSRR